MRRPGPISVLNVPSQGDDGGVGGGLDTQKHPGRLINKAVKQVKQERKKIYQTLR